MIIFLIFLRKKPSLYISYLKGYPLKGLLALAVAGTTLVAFVPEFFQKTAKTKKYTRKLSISKKQTR